MPNTIFYGENLKGVDVNATAVGKTQAIFNDDGYAEVDVADGNLVSAIEEQSGQAVDIEGTEEAITPDTVQTATTLSALVLRNSTGATVLNIRNEDAVGAVIFGPITLAANAERVIVLPTQLTGITVGVFVEEVSGALHATPGFLIP